MKNKFKFNVNILLFVFISCADIYSPFGVKGKDAKKEIEDLNGILSVVTILPLLSFDTSRSNFKCQTELSAVIGSTNSSTTANFSLPEGRNNVDLDARNGGTRYFRSNPATQATSVVIQSITTETSGSSVNCTSETSAATCSGAINTTFSVSSMAFSSSIPAGSCVSITCSSVAYIRILPSRVSFVNTQTSSNTSLVAFASLLIGPTLFDSIAGIKDDTYYTKESLQDCKKGITELSLLSSAISLNSLAAFRESVFCNKPSTSTPQITNPAVDSAVQGNECKLEEVNFIGF